MNALDRTQLRSVAPSIFTRSAYHKMTPRYKVAATADVIDLLEGIGLFPVRAQQSRCRLPDKRDFVRHLIRFRRSEDMNAGLANEIPEVVLTNSFDGSSAYKLDMGLFRVACLNGLVCSTTKMGGISVRHSGEDLDKRILDATYSIVSEAPSVMATVEEWKQIQLPTPIQHILAEAAHVLLDNTHVKPPQLLVGRRPEDQPEADGSRSLWKSMNTIQEAALKGGIQHQTASGRRTTTRAIKSVSNDLRLNKALWTLSSQLAQHLA